MDHRRAYPGNLSNGGCRRRQKLPEFPCTRPGPLALPRRAQETSCPPAEPLREPQPANPLWVSLVRFRAHAPQPVAHEQIHGVEDARLKEKDVQRAAVQEVTHPLALPM